MKNQRLKALLTKRAFFSVLPSDVVILNNDEIVFAVGGDCSVNCPSLTSCGCYSSGYGNGPCFEKCQVNVSL